MATLQPKKTYDINIAGVTFKIRSQQDEQTVQELSMYVDQKIRQAIQLTKSGSLQNASVIAALNIAEELTLLKRKAQQELEKLEQKALQLSQEIENSKAIKHSNLNS